MKFFSPIFQLDKKDVYETLSTEYFVHVVTFCPRTSFRADGYETDVSELDNGVFIVRVKLKQDPALPEMEYITPVVHTIALGPISFPGRDGVIRVDVIGEVYQTGMGLSRGADDPPATGGSGTQATSGAGSGTKPDDPNDLYSMF